MDSVHSPNSTCSVDMVLFDYGGVLANEGFEKGLKAIAARHGLVEADFFDLAHDLIHTTGYLTGHAGEQAYWQAIRDNTGIRDDDETLRNEILSRFVLRPWMIDAVIRLKESGTKVGILSDQTNWLDELNDRDGFFRYFDIVFNSYHLGKTKMDPSHFSDTVSRLGNEAERLLFVDDRPGHCERARSAGMKAIRYTGRESFVSELARFCPFLQ